MEKLTSQEVAALQLQIAQLTNAITFFEQLKPILLIPYANEYMALCWHLVVLKTHLENLQNLLNEQ